jgi:hypothetical protein
VFGSVLMGNIAEGWNQMVKIYWTFPYDKKVKCPFKIIYIYIYIYIYIHFFR